MLSQCCYLSRATHLSCSWQSYHLSSPTRFIKNVKNYTKIYKFCNIIVETRWNKFFLNLKYSNILSHCCYLSKVLIWVAHGRVITFRVLHDLQNVTIPQKYVILQSYHLSSYLSKGNSWLLELSPFIKNVKNYTKIYKFCNIIVETRFESYTIYKKRDNSTKICNFATSL